jgi:hypothetical protein
MKRSDIVENEPLLYIVQPKLERTVAYMQRTFQSKAAVKQKPERKSEWESDEIVQENLNQQQEKQFQQMSLEEKLSFLANLPAPLSHMKCKLVSTDGEKEGLIRKYDGTEITIDTASGTFAIPRKEVVSVALIGLSGKEEKKQRDGD